ncbi:hypothetical protein L596_013886 [Steinernema carpocapsae]|uniref:TIL domain-containing protein n=1 Tax=Steinernema carpocapsae TaxID=34508 RepID=A0A4U5P2W1_STECR|nr:hypothetical protein L596_013886 [Steinernema carpocapsae]
MKLFAVLLFAIVILISLIHAAEKCGPREIWVECGMCESTCEGKPPKCPPKCVARCTCWDGLVRHNKECISSSDCPNQ